MNEISTGWHISPASSGSRTFYTGHVWIRNLNPTTEKARFEGTIGSMIDGGTSTTNNSTTAAAISGHHRSTGVGQNELYLLGNTAGATITGYATLKKIKYT